MRFLNLMFIFSSGLALNLPSHFPKCCMEDPKISECIANAAETVKPFIKNGIKEIGIETFYPVVVENFKLSFSGSSGSFTNRAKNYTFYGMHDYQLVDFQFDPKNIVMKGKFLFKEIFSTCFYSMTSGAMVEVPVVGNGVFGGIVGPLNISFDLGGNLVKKNGLEYVKLDRVLVRFETLQYAVFLEGLWFENGPWGNTNDVLVSHNKFLGSSTTPAFDGIFGQQLTKYLQWFLNAIPYNKLFPC